MVPSLMSEGKSAEDLIAVFDKIGPGGILPAEAAMIAIQSQIRAIDQELGRLNGCKTTFDRHSAVIKLNGRRLRLSNSTSGLVNDSWAYIDKNYARDFTPYPCIEIKKKSGFNGKEYFILRKCGGACRFHDVVGVITEGPPEADKVQKRVQTRIEELLARRKKLDKILSVCVERIAEDYE
jgi:hypothetical protein